ncbi:FKBP-type peptidyl-prolyl cis-trans isomerase [Croceiramulus getboli]|nr:hypothetical protein P8624_09035 [Flavobacteriaceae bacterium YJPT1-3]
MNKNLLLLCSALMLVSMSSCNNDDDGNGVQIVPPRDRAEQAPESENLILEYLDTHFYNYEEFETPPADFDYQIKFDTIAGENSDKIPLANQVTAENVTFEGQQYTLRTLQVRRGAEEMPATTFADSTLMTFRGQVPYGSIFDSNATPFWIVQAGTIFGFANGVAGFKGASTQMTNPDGTVSFSDDFGIGAVFIPSGLGYYAGPPPGGLIDQYDSLIFTFQLYKVRPDTDNDQDGIPNVMEDVNENSFVLDDNTDGDNAPNYRDGDDDNDGTPTREEIIINEDGTITFPDADNDGTPDYLDPDTL